MLKIARAAVASIFFFMLGVSAAATEDSNWDYDAVLKDFRQTVGKMIEANTTNPPGNESKAVAIAKARLDSAKVPYEITEFAPGRQNIVARFKGTGKKKPILFLAHLDVVGAENQAWTVPSHKLTEKDGYLYGRGIIDDLGSAALLLETLIAVKKSGLVLNRDIILALTGDEESGGAGIQYILKNRRDSVDAVMAINEGGEVELDEAGKVKMLNLQVAEKTYRDFELIAKGTTGHSSVPKADNAIYKLSKALSALEKSPRPAKLIPVTRAYYAERAKIEKEPLQSAMLSLAKSKGALPRKALALIEKNPVDWANLRTTCVATMLSGGTRVNALPSEAKANVNCRILPDESTDEVAAYLKKVVNDPSIEVHEIVEVGGTAPASTLEGEALAAIRKVTDSMWPGLPIIPNMSRGATDSRYLRAAGIPS
jgi:acetylornithine deacetylase/succinyl-diaminopimelate desuccinylase-like protein